MATTATLTKAQQATLAIPTLPSLDEIVSAISLAHQSHGDSVDGKTSTSEALILKNEMQNRGYRLEKAELQTALLNGTFGKYGEVFRVCPTEMIVWVQGFIQEKALKAEQARKAKEAEEREKHKDEIKEENDRKEKEAQEKIRAELNNSFIYYRNNGDLPVHSPIMTKLLFRYLQRRGEIPEGVENTDDFKPGDFYKPIIGEDKNGFINVHAEFREQARRNTERTQTYFIAHAREEIRKVYDRKILELAQKQAETA